jgi:hypothetical protein
MKRTVIGASVAVLMAMGLGLAWGEFDVLARVQQPACAPLQMSDIEEYVEVKAPVAVVRRRIGECGLGFTFDKTAEDRLRTLGAPADLIGLLANLGRSGLEVRSTPAGAAVTIDGQRRGTTPLVLNDLAPGAHRVLLSLDGYLDNASEVTTRAGDTERVERTLTRAAAQPAAAAAPAKGGSKLPWILGGAAAVGGGVALAAGSGGGGGGGGGGGTGGTVPPTTTTATPTCNVTITRSSFSFGAGGGSQQADVLTNTANCTWAFSNIPSWLRVSPATFTGNNTVTFTADPNTVENGSSQSRSGTNFVLPPTTLTVTQEGVTCANTVATRDNLASVGNGGTVNAAQNDRYFTIQTNGECRWTARTSASWMYFRSNGTTTISGTGVRVGEDAAGEKLAVVFQQNTGGRRTGTITVATTTFNVTQCASTETSC